jgi:hypothetical protein
MIIAMKKITTMQYDGDSIDTDVGKRSYYEQS